MRLTARLACTLLPSMGLWTTDFYNQKRCGSLKNLAFDSATTGTTAADPCLFFPDYVVQDARVFTLLTTLPQTQISSYSTPESFSSRSALFSLSTADNRCVTWQCQLTNTGTWDGGLVAGLATVPTAGSIGTSTGWETCTDPQARFNLCSRLVYLLLQRSPIHLVSQAHSFAVAAQPCSSCVLHDSVACGMVAVTHKEWLIWCNLLIVGLCGVALLKLWGGPTQTVG